MPLNPWVEYVKKYAKEHGITYRDATSLAGPSYHAMKERKPAKKAQPKRTRLPPALTPGEFSNIARERDRDGMSWKELDSKAKHLMSKSIPTRPKRKAAKPKAAKPKAVKSESASEFRRQFMDIFGGLDDMPKPIRREKPVYADQMTPRERAELRKTDPDLYFSLFE